MAKITFIAKDGTRYSFANEAQLSEFVNLELAAWNWFIRFEGHGAVQSLFADIVGSLRAAATHLSQTPIELELVKLYFQSYLNSSPQAHAKAPFRSWLQALADKRPVQAFYALSVLVPDAKGDTTLVFGDVVGGQSDYVAGVAHGIGYKNSWSSLEQLTQATALIGTSALEAADAVAAAREKQAEIEALEVLVSDSNATRTANNTALDNALVAKTEELVTAMADKFAERSKSLEEQWNRFTAEFTSQLALKAPAGYWKSKHKSHTRWVTLLGVLFAVGAGGGAYILHNIAGEIFGALRLNQIPSWFQVITFSLAALVYVLLLRSVLRLMMSHVHLALDSAERQTMIVSYLALVRRGGIKEDSLDKILTSIFRPTGDGIVKDDGIPLSALAEIFKSK